MALESIPLCLVALFYLTGFATGFNPEIQMPYKAISGSAEISVIGSTLTCNEERGSIKECATECYSRRTTLTGCPGFRAGAVQSSICYLCHVSNYSEVSGNLFTTFTSDDILYLLAIKRVVPEISMDFENKTGNSFQGVGTVGTGNMAQITGVSGKGVHFTGTQGMRLTGSGTECWTNLDHCSSGITTSLWYKPFDTRVVYQAGTGAQFQQGFAFQFATVVSRISILKSLDAPLPPPPG